MSSLSAAEKVKLEKLLRMPSGYVSNFLSIPPKMTSDSGRR